MKKQIKENTKMKTLDVYSRLENTMTEILRSLGNIYDDLEERNNLNKNITNSIRKLRVIRRIVEKHGFDKEVKR